MPFGREPWTGELDAGKYAFCACGESANRPFCDGSHKRKNTGRTPKLVTLVEKQEVFVCQCGQSGKHPFCDDTHLTLQ